MSAAEYVTISCDHEGCEAALQVKTGIPQEARAELKKIGWVLRKFPRYRKAGEDRGRLPAFRGRGFMCDLCPEHASDKPEASK